MERVHYRKHSPSQLKSYQAQPQNERISAEISAPAEPVAQESKVKEKLISQALISAVIFAAVLTITIVDFPQAAEIRNSLSIALSEDINAEQVAGELRAFLGGITEYASEPVHTYPEYHSEYQENVGYPEYAGYTDSPTGMPIEMLNDPITIAPRIDEDILNEVFGTTEDVNIQPTAPEPTIPPEL